MSKIPSFSGHCDTATGHGASNFPRPRVVQSITYNIIPSTQGHFKQLCGWGDVVCELTEPPAVEGNLTPPVQLPHHSVQRKKVFWTWLEEMFISSNMRGDISLLNVYCGAAMIEVYLCSKKICDSMGFRAANRFRVDEVRPLAVFLCCLYFAL